MPVPIHLFFQLSGARLALPAAAVREMVLRPKLWHPPACPAALAGVLNLRGAAVPVVRLERLLGLAPGSGGPFAPLIVLRRPGGDWAIAADAALEVGPGSLLPAPEDSAFEGCVAGMVEWTGGKADLLLPDRLLQQRELAVLRDFQEMAARRFEEWRGA